VSIIAVNKKAKFDYELLEFFEAGIVLTGDEVKAIRNGQVNLKGSYVVFKNTLKILPELYLINATITKYKYSSTKWEVYTIRSRKLLLKKSEINKLLGKASEKGLTLVPTKIYTKNNLIKLEFSLAKGKKKYDKREDIKKREIDRDIKRTLKNE
jgi:SsrA-binding protein